MVFVDECLHGQNNAENDERKEEPYTNGQEEFIVLWEYFFLVGNKAMMKKKTLPSITHTCDIPINKQIEKIIAIAQTVVVSAPP